jgi:hypothetical protein
MQTKVVCKCMSKKESPNFYNGDVKAHPVVTEIELQVPYDTSSIYFTMSGGTNLILKTINEEAANMFKLNKDYEILIGPVEEV